MTKKIKENMSFVSNLAHSLVIKWKMSTILTKMFCRIQNGRTLQKKHICMQNKLHAEQFSLFPFQLVDNQADGLCLFYGVISFLKDQNISLSNDFLSVSVRNIRDKKTVLESGIVASLLEYLSKLNAADFGELIQYADFSGEKVDIDMFPPEYHEDINKIVENFSDKEIKVESLNWIATLISEMINATPDPNCS